jgi:2-polyprenyl-3-methyl-5-hydroxy-6-metoxy-1,4-benzoquinol methylase
MRKINEKCAICKGEDFNFLFDINGKKIIECSNCSLSKTADFKFPDYQKYHGDDVYKKYEKHFVNFYIKRFDIISKFVSKIGAVLDIGCSRGTFLEIFKNAGWEAWGIESSGSAKFAKRRGIKVFKKRFEDVSLPEKYFDLVILNHTLEHVENPVEVLSKIKRILKNDGLVFVDVPNFGSLSAKILKSKWPYILPEEHIHHFSQKSIKMLFDSCGYKVVYLKSRSGIWDFADPLKGLKEELFTRKKAFLLDFVTSPFSLITTLINRGTALSVLAKKQYEKI